MKKRYLKYIKKLRKKIKSFKSRNLLILTISAFVILLVGISTFSFIVKAEVTNLYPGSCLGGWINTQNVQGRPSLDPGASFNLFNDSNSAVLKNAIAQIFCGSFNGVIPQDNEPKKVFLKFSWNIFEKPIVAATSSATTIIGEDSSSSTPQIIDETSDQVENISEQATSSPSSFWNLFTNAALAEETVMIASSTLDNPATSTPDVLDSGEFLEISYTLDGVNWIMTGRINRNNWRNAQFELPITNWTDIQKVQISLQSLPTIDESPTVYLDNIWLEVLYGSENLTTAISGFFGIEHSDEKTVFISSLYNRSPSGNVVTSPVAVKISLKDFVKDTLGCGEFDYWGVAFRYKNESTAPELKSKFVVSSLRPSSIKTFDESINLPIGEITQAGFSCWPENLDPNAQDYGAQENSIAGDLEIIDFFNTPIFKIVQ